MAHASKCSLLAAAGLYVLATLGVHAQDKRPSDAEDYPGKPVRLIIAAPPGGIGMDPLGGNDEAFSKYFHAEVTKWAKVIRDAKISGE